jgi:hypothetical protein
LKFELIEGSIYFDFILVPSKISLTMSYFNPHDSFYNSGKRSAVVHTGNGQLSQVWLVPSGPTYTPIRTPLHLPAFTGCQPAYNPYANGIAAFQYGSRPF